MNDLEEWRVLVVDDSALMRKVLTRIIETDPAFKVVDVARDGEDAVEKARTLRPDVVTMDVNMPKMDGLTALQIIVEEAIAPVVVVSSLTQDGSITTFEALELGAFDCVAKPGGTVSSNLYLVQRELLEKLRAACKASRKERILRKLSRQRSVPRIEKKPLFRKGAALSFSAVAIGISTGGPKTIYDVLPFLPGELNAAVFLVQHMPPTFTRPYAERLNNYCLLRVVEAENGMEVEPGVVYVGKGGYHLKVERNGERLKIRLSTVPKHMFIPSVDVMMMSVLEVFGEKTVGVLMTGMGDDGAEAMVKIRQNGGYTIAESEETAIVFGMPQEAIVRGGADVVLPSYRIYEEIVKKVGTR